MNYPKYKEPVLLTLLALFLFVASGMAQIDRPYRVRKIVGFKLKDFAPMDSVLIDIRDTSYYSNKQKKIGTQAFTNEHWSRSLFIWDGEEWQWLKKGEKNRMFNIEGDSVIISKNTYITRGL